MFEPAPQYSDRVRVGAVTDEDREQARAGALHDYDVLDGAAYPELDALVELAARLCNVAYSSIALVDHERLYTVAAHGYRVPVQSRDGRMSSAILAVLGDGVLMVSDASADARFADNPYVTGEDAAFRLIATVGLRTPAGHIIGVLTVCDGRTGTLSEDVVHLLQIVGRQIVGALELRRRGRISQEIIAELSRSHEQLAQFAAQISHDLKTPLTSTIGFAELLQDMPTITAEPTAAGYVERIAASGTRMLTLIEDVLGYARIGGSLRKEPVQLRALIGAVLEDLGALCGYATIRSDDVTLIGDPAQLRTLLQNLIVNAITYRRAEVPCVIVVTASRAGRHVELRVSDNGRGIPAHERTLVLEPFHRLDGGIPGTGLGLATCERIVTAHGGRIDITDTPGGGATFRIYLPA
ncbi:MAG TPA: GAF domain-containing sensor histidine kinase [Jatrophihabitantaceae bacterium]|jgi:signal transduction histidine kinase|nr:GAF domain-containing sensor histidine kinase [Jatrophihabitantaceae bacterium]